MPGNLLDPLLALLVQEDGVSFQTRHALNFIGFSLTDDPANNRINVAGGVGGGGSLAGDVIGEADATRVVSISGDEENAEVQLFASALYWDPTVSEGEAEISLSPGELDAGALQFVHGGKRALLALGGGPVLGNDAAINGLVGGLRLTLRSIAASTALDTLTKDAIGWIDASSERTVTLPPASAGRVLLLPFVGGTTPTLQRFGSELINGVAGNYAMTGDANGGLTVAVSNGVNWVARTIREIVDSGLVGDVNGDLDANYISQITGSGGEVLVLADNLIFTTHGEAEIKTTSEGDGAIEITNDGSRVVYAHASTPEFGTDAGINRMRGGMRHTLRSVTSTTLDATTKDAIAWIDATGERTVTLPPASAGRTLLLPFVGDNAPTLARAGAELINGIAGNYDMQGDAAGGLGVAISDGVNWVARVIRAGAAADIAGDVNGPAHANYITSISGYAEGSGSVLVLATELDFDGTAAISNAGGEGDGAIELSHLGTRVVFAHSGVGDYSGPEFGAVAGISLLRGGLRLATKNTAVDVTLDASTKESVVHVDASVAARNVTLPEAMGDGRVYIFMIKGSNTVTIKRFTGNTINSVAADYIVPLPNSCVIASCGSGGWFVRSFADSMGVTMGPGPGSATGSLSKTFGFAYAANANANFDLTTATYAGLKASIDAGKVVMVKALTQCWYNWAPGSVAILATATSTVSPTLQGAPLFDGSESPEKVPPGSTFLNILGGPVAGILTVYLAE